MPTAVTKSVRVRSTPYSARVEAAGVKAYTVYNHTLLATCFRSVEEDCAHLKSAVQLWDVSCERQVEIIGPDARQLIQMVTPRDLSRMSDDQCYYIPAVDARGYMLNDPVLIRLAADRYWISLADGDLALYCKGLAAGFDLDVEVFEADVSPLAIQGPKAEELAARVFGEGVRTLRFFRHMQVEAAGRQMVLARSGWSKQGGFELYMDDWNRGETIWDTLMAAGGDLDVRVGCPNNIERIESGLLSYGSDMDCNTTALEAGLGKYCHLDTDTGCLARQALIDAGEPDRQIRAVAIAGSPTPAIEAPWSLVDGKGRLAGKVTSVTYSPQFETNVAIAMVERQYLPANTRLLVNAPDGQREAIVRESFWR